MKVFIKSIIPCLVCSTTATEDSLLCSHNDVEYIILHNGMRLNGSCKTYKQSFEEIEKEIEERFHKKEAEGDSMPPESKATFSSCNSNLFRIGNPVFTGWLGWIDGHNNNKQKYI